MPEQGGDSQNRDRGSFRGRRRRRGGRRDGRGDGRDRGSDRNSDRGSDRSQERTSDRGSESRFSRPVEPTASRSSDSARYQPSGPPPGYQPILLPGESISKYQRLAQQPPAQYPPAQQAVMDEAPETPAEPVAPLAATFPEDEPIFAASETVAEPLHEEHDDTLHDPRGTRGVSFNFGRMESGISPSGSREPTQSWLARRNHRQSGSRGRARRAE